jgi:glutamine synthetase
MQSIAEPNVVLNSAVAKSLSDFYDELKDATDFPAACKALIGRVYHDHKRIVYNGNNYSEEWVKEAEKRGLSNYKTAPEAYAHLDDEKNVSLFEQFGVMSRTELKSRREIYFANYRKIKNIEARTMLEMTMRDYIPAVSKYVGKLSGEVNALTAAYPAARVTESVAHIEKLSSLLEKTYVAYGRLDAAQRRATEIEATEEAAFFYKGEVSSAMEALREAVDSMETLCARECWPVPTYGDITFGI